MLFQLLLPFSYLAAAGARDAIVTYTKNTESKSPEQLYHSLKSAQILKLKNKLTLKSYYTNSLLTEPAGAEIGRGLSTNEIFWDCDCYSGASGANPCHKQQGSDDLCGDQNRIGGLVEQSSDWYCGPGNYANTEKFQEMTAESCKPCPKGYFCFEGTYGSDPATIDNGAPQPCPAGRYGDGESSSDALCSGPCKEGYHCPPKSTSSEGTGPCPAGYYCPIIEHVTLLEGGTVLVGSPPTFEGIPSPEGLKRPENIIIENAFNVGSWGGTCYCPDGSSYEVGDIWGTGCGEMACVGAIEVVGCNQNSGSWAGRKVVCIPNEKYTIQEKYVCPKGHYCDSGSPKPKPCPAGRYGPDRTGLTSKAGCILCQEGTYSNAEAALDSNTCTPCVDGTYSSAGSEKCTDCYEGFECKGGQLEQCPQGHTSDGTNSCSQCPGGYFCPGATPKFQCGSVSLYCPGEIASEATKPKPVAKGYYSTPETGEQNKRTGQAECPAGNYCSGGVKAPCNAKVGEYQDETGQGKCKVCTPGTVPVASTDDNYDSCKECVAGKYAAFGASECKPCAEGSYSSNKAATCTQCLPGKKANKRNTPTEGAMGCKECEKGTYQDEAGKTECKACDAVAGSLKDEGSLACKPCPAGTYLNDAGPFLTPLSGGNDGNAKDLQACVGECDNDGQCASGLKCYQRDGYADIPGCQGQGNIDWDYCYDPQSFKKPTSECVECKAGTYSEGGTAEKCELCAEGSYSSTKAATCTQCLPGKKANKRNKGATGCEACEKGTYQDEAGKTECKACDAVAGSLKDKGSLACKPCPAGTYLNDATFGKCVECKAGTYSVGGTAEKCELCAEGSYSSTKAATCTQCLPGKKANKRNKGATGCEACEKGTYQDEAGKTECKACDAVAGSLKDKGSLACKPCPAGTYLNDATFGKCVECKAGTYSVGGTAEKCELCAEGSYSSTKAATCTQCLPGKKANKRNKGATGCEACEKGTYQDEPSKTECKMCGEGTIASTPETAFCEVCRQGEYANEYRNACLPCMAGFKCVSGIKTPCEEGKASASNASFCEACIAGTYLSNSVCTKCPPGMFSKAGWSNCKLCEAGKYQNGTDCIGCDAGKWGATAGLASSNCSGTCPPGWHSSRYDTKCHPCEAGKAQPLAGKETCKPCPDRRTSRANATVCYCDVSRYENAQGHCVPCIEGMDCTMPGNDVASLRLDPGHWRPHASSTEVLKCPFPEACSTNGSSCVLGNIGPMCAVCAPGYYRPSTFASCVICGDETSAILAACGILCAMVVALGGFVHVNRRAPNGLLRPFIDLVQKVTVMLMFDAPFPKALTSLYKVLAGMSFGLEVASPQCAWDGTNFYTMLSGTMVFVLLVVFVLMGRPVWTKLRSGHTWSEMIKSQRGAAAMRDTFVIVLLLHPTVSGKSMEFFRCRTINGETYLMADYSIKCYDGEWYVYLFVVLAILCFFSLGAPIAIAYVLYQRRKTLYEDDGSVKAQPLDILYAIYQPNAYFYEAVQMVFKLGLWSTLVFFPHGSPMQLATALIVNVLQLVIHTYVLPMGGDEAVLLNVMQAATLVITAYINFGALCMNYLELEKALALHVDPERVGDYDAPFALIKFVMQVLTFGLFATFGAVAIKHAVTKARHMNLNKLRERGLSAARTLRSSTLGSSKEEAISRLNNQPGGSVIELTAIRNIKETSSSTGTHSDEQAPVSQHTFALPFRTNKQVPPSPESRAGRVLSTELASFNTAKGNITPKSFRRKRGNTSEGKKSKERTRTISTETKALENLPIPSRSPLSKQSELSELPSAWKECTTAEGTKYYHNRQTKESSWVRPQHLAPQSST